MLRDTRALSTPALGKRTPHVLNSKQMRRACRAVPRASALLHSRLWAGGAGTAACLVQTAAQPTLMPWAHAPCRRAATWGACARDDTHYQFPGIQLLVLPDMSNSTQTGLQRKRSSQLNTDSMPRGAGSAPVRPDHRRSCFVLCTKHVPYGRLSCNYAGKASPVIPRPTNARIADPLTAAGKPPLHAHDSDFPRQQLAKFSVRVNASAISWVSLDSWKVVVDANMGSRSRG